MSRPPFKRYRTLSMFDLQHGVTAVDLMEGTSLVIATSAEQKHEICELLLPDKLLQTSQDGKIKKDRDFRVHTGGFSNRLLTEVKHIPETRYCAVAKNDGTSSIWEMGNETTDLMKEYKPIKGKFRPECTIKIAVCGDRNNLVIGSCLKDLLLVNTESLMINEFNLDSDMEGSKQISSMQFIAEDELLCCTLNGNLFNVDTRMKSGIIDHGIIHEKSAHYWLISNYTNQSQTFLQLSNEGEVILLDKRSLRVPVSTYSTDLSSNCNFESLCIQQSLECYGFSVSGFDGFVHLYSTQSTEPSKSLEPVFVHEGHVINTDSQSKSVIVTKHVQHPWHQDLIISCGNDGSIHAWQWNDESIVT